MTNLGQLTHANHGNVNLSPKPRPMAVEDDQNICNLAPANSASLRIRNASSKTKTREEKRGVPNSRRIAIPDDHFPTSNPKSAHCSGARGPPQFLKNAPRMLGANDNLSCGFPSILGIAPGVAPRIVVSVWHFVFREWNFVFREWTFEFRELLREYPGTLRELQEWPFHSESVFPEIGVVPRLLNCTF